MLDYSNIKFNLDHKLTNLSNLKIDYKNKSYKKNILSTIVCTKTENDKNYECEKTEYILKISLRNITK